METNNNFKTSFIPKQSVVDNPANKVSRPISLMTTITFVVLLLSVALAGGAYGYIQLLKNEINRPCPDSTVAETTGCGLKASLEKERQALDDGLLVEFRRLGAKLTLAERLLDQHITALPILVLLQGETTETVRYDSLNYNDKTLQISGVARSYEDIAVQSNVFDKEKAISGFIFSDLNLDANGNVAFKLIITIDDKLLDYKLSL